MDTLHGSEVLDRVRELVARYVIGVLGLVIRVHNVPEDFPNLRVLGIETYPDRACLLPGIVFVLGPEDPDMRYWLEDMKRVGIGPDEVLWLTPENKEDGLYKAMLESPVAIDVIGEVLRAGGRFEPFCTSVRSEEVIEDLAGRLRSPYFNPGKWHFACPQREIAEIWNNKVETRNMLQAAGHGGVFPDFWVCKTFPDLVDAVKNASKFGSYVVKSDPTAASTEGMSFFKQDELPTDETIEAWKAKDWSRPALVDHYVDHVPFSMTWGISDDGARFGWASLQVLHGIEPGSVITIDDIRAGGKGAAHEGNVVGACGQDIGPITADVVAVADIFMRPVLEEVWQSGYRGFLNMDLALDSAKLEALRIKGESLTIANIRRIVYMLEFNARTSNSSYTAGVQSAIARRFEGGCGVVFMANVDSVDPDITSYAAAKDRLVSARLFYDGNGPGVQLYHVRLLGKGLEKCGVLAIAENYEKALALYRRAQQVLSWRVYESLAVAS